MPSINSNVPQFVLKALETLTQALANTKCQSCPKFSDILSSYIEKHRDEILDPNVVVSLDLPEVLSSIFSGLFKELTGKNPTIVPMDAYKLYIGPGSNISTQIYRYILLLSFNIAVCIATFNTKEMLLNWINPDLTKARAPEIVMAIVELCSNKDPEKLKISVDRLIHLANTNIEG